MAHSCIKWRLPTPGSVNGSLVTILQICNTKRRLSLPVLSCLGWISQNTLIHLCFQHSTAWWLYRRKVIWYEMLPRTGSYPYLLLATADGPGMTYLNGLVGHMGAYGCRLYCPTKGRYKPNVTWWHWYSQHCTNLYWWIFQKPHLCYAITQWHPIQNMMQADCHI